MLSLTQVQYKVAYYSIPNFVNLTKEESLFATPVPLMLSLTQVQYKVAYYSIPNFVILTKEESLFATPVPQSFNTSAKFSTLRKCFSVSN